MIRTALPGDVPRLLELIHDLAAYEKEPDAVETTEADLEAALFGPDPVAGCLVAESEGPVEPGKLVGIACWFRTFSTWTGRPGIWLEDLYVDAAHRRHGHGRDLLAGLAAICVENGWPRLEWTVLDWNSNAQKLYRAVGALPQDDWTTQRVSGAALAALARITGTQQL